MAQATTTFASIRDSITTVIEALTPALLNRLENKFRRCPDRRQTLEAWALTHGADICFRKFDIRTTGPVTDPEVLDPRSPTGGGVRRVTQLATLTMAYPVQVALYGSDDLDDMEDVIESDAVQVRDAVFSPGNVISGQVCAIVTVEPVDRGDNTVWFQRYVLEIIYYKAQTLT